MLTPLNSIYNPNVKDINDIWYKRCDSFDVFLSKMQIPHNIVEYITIRDDSVFELLESKGFY